MHQLTQFLGPFLKDPSEADSVAEDLFREMEMILNVNLQRVVNENSIPFHASGKEEVSGSVERKGLYHNYSYEFPTEVRLRAVLKVDWQDLLDKSLRKVARDLKVKPSFSQDFMPVIRAIAPLFEFGPEYTLNDELEDKILRWASQTRDFVESLWTTNNDPNRSYESVVPDPQFRLRWKSDSASWEPSFELLKVVYIIGLSLDRVVMPWHGSYRR